MSCCWIVALLVPSREGRKCLLLVGSSLSGFYFSWAGTLMGDGGWGVGGFCF